MSESKKALIVARIEPFLEAHARDPERYPRTLLAYAEFVPCARRLLYDQQDPDVVAVADRLRGRSAASTPGPALFGVPAAPAPAGTLDSAGLADDELRADVERLTSRATWAMQRFVGHHRTPAAADGALVLHDLQETLGALRGVHDRLAPIVAELHDRQRRRLREQDPQQDAEQGDEGGQERLDFPGQA